MASANRALTWYVVNLGIEAQHMEYSRNTSAQRKKHGSLKASQPSPQKNALSQIEFLVCLEMISIDIEQFQINPLQILCRALSGVGVSITASDESNTSLLLTNTYCGPSLNGAPQQANTELELAEMPLSTIQSRPCAFPILFTKAAKVKVTTDHQAGIFYLGKEGISHTEKTLVLVAANKEESVISDPLQLENLRRLEAMSLCIVNSLKIPFHPVELGYPFFLLCSKGPGELVSLLAKEIAARKILSGKGFCKNDVASTAYSGLLRAKDILAGNYVHGGATHE